MWRSAPSFAAKPLSVSATAGSSRRATRTRSGVVTGAPRSRARAFGGAARTVPVDDALVAEPRAGEQRVVGIQQRLVAAPVDARASRARRRWRAASRYA